MDTPTSGRVTVSGKEVSSMSKTERSDLRRDHVGFIFQSYNLIPVLTAQENTEFVLLLQGKSEAERNQRAREILKAVGLEGMEGRRPAELSGGQQQRGSGSGHRHETHHRPCGRTHSESGFRNQSRVDRTDATNE